LGGKSDDSASREMINQQKQEAEIARQKEAERQARINKQLARVKAAFEGTPVTKAKLNTATIAAPGAGTAVGAAATGLPAGYSWVRGPNTPVAPTAATQSNVQTNDLSRFGHDAGSGSAAAAGAFDSSRARGTGGGPAAPTPQAVVAPNGEWLVKGPDGKLHKIGEKINWNTQVDTGKRTGGPQAFLDKFKAGYLANYLPQVADKFKEARDQTTYDLAAAGTLRSSIAGDELAKLAKQNKLNEADVRTKATEAVGDLKTRLNKEEATANQQVMSVENPEVAASNALTAVQNITAEKPTNTPLGTIFDIAAIGGANYLKGANNKRLLSQVPGAQPATRIINV
jgi:hypothetical protein